MNPPLRSLLIFCIVAASAAQTTDVMSTMTTSATAGTTDATISTTAGTTDTTISTTAGTTDTTISTTAGTSDTMISTTAGTTGTMISTTAGTTDATISTTAGTTGTTISTTAGTTDATISTTAGTTGTMISTTAGTTDITTSTSAPVTEGPCASNPCVGNSICEERFGGVFECVCQPGLVYDDTRGCNLAKVFPGDLVLGDTFQDSMSDTTSALFKETSDRIQKQLRDTLKGDGYLDSVVLSLKPSQDRTRSVNAVARVQNFYEISSSATNQTVGALIDEAIKAGDITSASAYTRLSVCNIGYCDSNTTSCDGEGTAVCTCKAGYVRSQFTDQACIACPSGEKAVDGLCEKCTFGFAGFNCGDPYLLVVVVVSCGLGTLLIVFIVALIVVSCSKQKKSSPSKDFSPYGNVEMQKPSGVPRIPRANPNSGYQTENLEVTNSGSTQSLVTRNQPDNKTRYTNSDNDDMRYRSHDPSERGMENGLRGVQNPYYRQDYDSMRRY